MTLHETAYERKRNAQSYLLLRLRLLSLQRRKTRDAQRRLFGRRRSHHLVEQRRVFVSRSLRESNNKSFDIFFYCAEMPKRTKGKCPKEQRDRWWTHERMDFDFDRRECCVLVLLCRRPISRQKKEREERQNLKNFKKNQTPL